MRLFPADCHRAMVESSHVSVTFGAVAGGALSLLVGSPMPETKSRITSKIKCIAMLGVSTHALFTLFCSVYALSVM